MMLDKEGNLRCKSLTSVLRVVVSVFFFLSDPATPEISPLALHAALPIPRRGAGGGGLGGVGPPAPGRLGGQLDRLAGARRGRVRRLHVHERSRVLVEGHAQLALDED